jgi:nitroreductase
MDVNEAIYGRRSIREYAADQPDDETLRRLIDAAVQAPNASNEQDWAFTVVRDQDTLDGISRAAKVHMLGTMGPGPAADRHRRSLMDPDFQIFYHAPVLILISGTAHGPWVVEDCALAAENLMLAAHGAGLGTCWIGYAQGFLNTPEGRRALDLPEDWVQVAPIIVGRPRTIPVPAARREPRIRWVG